jgi:signal transduction histidine kinase
MNENNGGKMIFLKNAIYQYIDNRLDGKYTPIGSHIRIAVSVILFIFLLFIQSMVSPLSNAVIAQLQVMISIYLTVSVPLKGYIAAIAVNIIEIIVITNIVFVLGFMTALPGFIIPFFTIITITIIFIFGRRLFQKHFKIIKQQDELSAAKEEAETANRAKSDFLSSISHEIRSPMNSILGYIEIMPRENLNKEQIEYLSIVSSNAHDLVSIINDILDASKVEHGKMLLDSVSFNPAEKIGLVLKFLEIKARRKNISLIFHHEKTSDCLGDPLRLGQIITNLVENSIKFTPQNGHIDVVLSSNSEGDFLRCYIEVHDTGAGIPYEEQVKIFESFTQENHTVSNNFGGIGLGLSISSHLVAMMGGELSVESTPGKGSKFYFSINLPVAPAGDKTEKKDICLELFSDKK